MYCAECGTANSPTAKYCNECGSRLEPAAAVLPVSTEAFELPSLEEAETRVQDLLRLAFLALDRRDLEGALRYCLEALKVSPASAPAHSLLGLIYERMGRLVEAVREYETAVQLDPHNQADRLTLARLRGEPVSFPTWSLPFADWVPAAAAAGAALLTLLVCIWPLFGGRSRPQPAPVVAASRPEPAVDAMRRALASSPAASTALSSPRFSQVPSPPAGVARPGAAFSPPEVTLSRPRQSTGGPDPSTAAPVRPRASSASPPAPQAAVTVPPVEPAQLEGGSPAEPVREPETTVPSAGDETPAPPQGYIRLEVRPPSGSTAAVPAPQTPAASATPGTPQRVVPQQRDLQSEARSIEQRAGRLAAQGRYELAIMEYQRALRTAPNYADAGRVWQQIALCQQRLKRDREALDAYRRAEDRLRERLGTGQADPAAESALRAVRSARELLEEQAPGDGAPDQG